MHRFGYAARVCGFAALFTALRIATLLAAGVEVERVEQPPVVDGVLDDPAWEHAAVVSDFQQRLPVEGAPPSEKTEVRLVYTTQALYIGFRAYDSHGDKIVATALKRDDPDVVKNDQLAFAIDSYNDSRSGYWFSTNPLGVRVDAQFSDEGDLWEDNWNGVWQCQTRILKDGWTAEIEIPFSTLRFQPAASNIMGINFFRRIVRTNEQIFAPLIPLSYSNGTPNVSAARKYVFQGIRGGSNFLLKPYGLSGFDQESPSGGRDARHDAGFDTRYRFTDSLTGSFSLNTDFAEAEVDDQQINLTQFKLFFPEKRDFFLESAANFLFGLQQQTEIFFSRRIGLSDAGEPAPILFGSKLTGKLGMFDIGFLDVQTRASGIKPAENFGVLRFRAGIAPRSYIGAILTNKMGDKDASFRTFGIDLNLYLLKDINLTGFAAYDTATNRGGAPADSLALARSGERTSFRIGYEDVSPSFDPAMGFVIRSDIRRWDGNLFVPWYLNRGGFRNITPGYEFVHTKDHAGNLSETLNKGSLNFVFLTEDQATFFADWNEQTVTEPFEIFRGHFVSPGQYRSSEAGMSFVTKEGRALSGTLDLLSGGFFGGSRVEVTPGVQWKAGRHFTLTQDYSTNFVKGIGPDFTTQLLRSRVDYALDTHLSASALLQYNNDLRATGYNIRFGYLFREGTELFVVYDQQGHQKSLIVKFTYLFSL